MKIALKSLLLVAVLYISGGIAQATVTIELDAGILKTQQLNTPLPAGSLLQIVATRGGASGVFSAPTIGNYVNGDNLIVASFAMNNGFSTGETDNVFSFTLENTAASSPSSFDQGDALLLRWFPTITYAQFLTGTLPTANTPYGQYRSNTGEGGGIAWFTPADGTTLSVPNGLNFLTTAIDGPNPESAGVANLTVVPEPSTYAFLALGVPLFFVIRRRVTARIS